MVAYMLTVDCIFFLIRPAGLQLKCVTSLRFERGLIAGPASSSIRVRKLAHTPDGCNRPKSDPNVYPLSLHIVPCT